MLARHRRRGRDHQGRARPGDQPRRRHRRRRRPRRPAHDRRPDPGLHREGPRRHRRQVHAEGRDRDRHGPDRRRRARDGELAAGRPQRPLRRRPGPATTWRPASPTSRARPSRRSPSPARSRTAWSRPRPPSTCRPRSRSPTGRSTSRTRPATGRSASRDILAQSSNVGAVTIGLELGDRRVQQLGPTLRLRPPDRDRLPGRGAGHRPDAGRVLGLLDRQPADRPGPLGDADADDGGLRRDRQRRHPADAAADRVGRRQPGRALRRPPGDQQEDLRRSCGRCSRACSAQGGTASEVSVPGYVLAGKTGTAQKVVDGTYSDTQYVASFVGFAPGRRPELLVAVIVDEPKGGDYYGGSVAAPAFGQIASSRFPTSGSPRPMIRAAAAVPACRVPRIAGDEARRAKRRAAGRGGAGRRRRRTDRRSPTSPSTAARVGPGALFFCVRGSTADGHDFAPAVRRGRAPWRSSSSASSTLAVPQLVVRRLAGGDGADRGAVLRRSERRAPHDRRDRDERQDDHRLPGPLDPRGGRHPHAACSARSSRSSAGRWSRSSGPPRRRSTCSGRSGGCSTPATGPA